MSDLRDVSLTCQSVPPNLQNCPCTSCTNHRRLSYPERIEIDHLTEENKRLGKQIAEMETIIGDLRGERDTIEAKLRIARQALEDIGHRFQRKHLADVSAMGLLGRAEGIASQALQRMEG